MYLKSLVLKGFKSFADRSVLSLEPGITAIVGPNGSGKSNILDAVRWVLGELNARNLRGQAMEDVIFAGSATRKPVSVAEVTLVLDNGDQTLPVDYDEVAVTRRMYRNGESEYLLNGTVCRRMDVLDLLHDSGLGTGTHSIISQGHLDAVLQSKPLDRRALIEEAAGVLKHKQRKEKSARKLERMEQHLLRVNDITAEVERQLKPLGRKARKAQTYQEVSAELTDLSLRLAVDDLRVLQKQWDQAKQRESQLKETLNQAQLAAYASDGTVRDLQRQLQGHRDASGKAAEGLHKLQSAAQRLDSTSLLLAEKRRSVQRAQEDAARRLEEDEQRVADAQAEQAQAQESFRAAQQAFDQADAERQQAKEAHDTAAAALAESQRNTSRLQADNQRLKVERDRLQAQKQRNEQALSNSMADDKSLAARQDDLTQRQTEAAEHLAAVRTQADEAQQAFEAARAADAQARQVTGAALRAVEQARSQARAAQVAASKAAAHAAALQEAEETHRKENRAQTWANERLAQLADRTPPVLADVLQVPENLVELVDAVLGPWAQAAFSPDAAASHQALRQLSQARQSGTASLLDAEGGAPAPAAYRDAAAQTGSAASDETGREPAASALDERQKACALPVAEPSSDPTRTQRLQAPAGTRYLSDLVSCPADFRPAVQALLGRVLVADSWEAAAEAERQLPVGACLQMVTVDGYRGNAQGLHQLVVPEKGRDGAVARHRRLQQALAQSAEAEQSQQQAAAQLSQAEERLRQAQKNGANTATQAAQAQGRSDSLRTQRADAEKQVKALAAEHDQLAQKRNDVAAVLERMRPAGARIEEQLTQTVQKLAENATELDAATQQQGPLQQAAVQASERYTKARLEAGTLEERRQYAERMASARTREVQQLQKRIEQARVKQARLQPAEVLDPVLRALDSLRETVTTRIGVQERSRDAAAQAGEGVHARIDEARRTSSKLHGQEADATAKLADVRVTLGRLEVQVQTAIDSIEKDRSTPLDRALQLPAVEDRERAEIQVDKLRRRIKNMGTINPDAAAEYEQLKARYDYLKGQTDDLLAARASLRKIVAVIDERMKDDFVNTYRQVDANFQEIFAELFPGGQAHLSLEDPDDAEHSGVEVHAQPRGKRIAKLSLMSGGEKSLTALALLFAVYRTRATPFYILDEVEAALDDSNLRRLCAYWQKMRTHTQLIMITHQRRTMEMADVLYGISMQSDGVTKLLSQRLSDYAEDSK